MNSYEELSRKGLIRLAEDYDDHSSGALESFVKEQEGHGVTYPLITPAEKLFDNFEDTKIKIIDGCKEKIDDAGKFVDHLFEMLVGDDPSFDTEKLKASIDITTKDK